METTSSANSVINQMEYDFPADLSVFRSMKYKGYRLKQMSFNEFNEYLDGYSADPGITPYGPGIPSVFMVWNNKITVFPKPSEAIVGGFTLYYMRHCVQVATVADVPEVPVQYHKALVDYCLQQAYELDEDENKYNLKKADFEQKTMKLNDRNKWLGQEVYPRITVLPEDAGFSDNGYGGY